MGRRLLEAVDAGALDASDPKGRAILRRLQGAVTAWDAAAGRPNREDR